MLAMGILKELRGACRHASDVPSFIRLGSDILLFRVLRIIPRLANKPRLRSVRLDGATISYRLNRGDIQSIREVWFEEAYRVPMGPVPKTVLDLGANIGLTSVWLARTYGCQLVIGVEPDPANVALARRNLAANHVPGTIINAAAGPADGIGSFACSTRSNIGNLITGSSDSQTSQRLIDVAVLAPETILRTGGLGTVDLCKLDIEGAEGPLLLDSEPSWLSSVNSILAEIHETVVDARAVTAVIEGFGLRHYRAGIAGRKTEFFARDLD